jgi:hypothetical protein
MSHNEGNRGLHLRYALPKQNVTVPRLTLEWLQAVGTRGRGVCERAVINSLVCGWREISWKGSCLQSTSRSGIAYSAKSAKGDYREAQFRSSCLGQWRNTRSLLLKDGYEFFNLSQTTRNWRGTLSQASKRKCSSYNKSGGGGGGTKGERRKSKINKRETKTRKMEGSTCIF